MKAFAYIMRPVVLALLTSISTAVALPANGSVSDLDVTNSTKAPPPMHDKVDCFEPSSRAPSEDCHKCITHFTRKLSDIWDSFTITKWPLSLATIRVPKTIKYGRCTLKLDLQKFTPDLDDVTKSQLQAWGYGAISRCFGRRSASAEALFRHEFDAPGLITTESRNTFSMRFTLDPDDLSGNNTSPTYEEIDDDTTATAAALYPHVTASVATS